MSMKDKKIIVKTESSNLWWGIYGFCDKTGWEDLSLFTEDDKLICGVCLNAKAYLQTELKNLKNNIEEKEYLEAIGNYLKDDKCHYWYYYGNGNEEVHEVPYNAPLNANGEKPKFIDILHPDKKIGLSTIKTAVKAFAKKHLGIDDCEVEIECDENFEESLKSFKENEKLLGREFSGVEKFTDELIEDLSLYWQISREGVLKKLRTTFK